MKFSNLSGNAVSVTESTAPDSTTGLSMLSPRKFRIVMYSHDTYGLGHLTRTVRLAQGIVSALRGASVLIISGSPVAHNFAFPRGVDYVKLPSLVKTGPESYMARELNISAPPLRRLRSAIILDTIKIFRPHLFFVDNVPLGMKGELRPILRWLRNKQPHVRIHLNLRDILDHPDVLLPLWEEQGVIEAIQEFYDSVHVFGCRDIYDAVAAYGLPCKKTEHLGYIAPGRPDMDGKEDAKMPQGEDGKWRILVTAGGGGDGHAIFHSVLDIQKSLGPSTPFQFFMIAGPLMEPESYREIYRKAEGTEGVYLQNKTENLAALMARSDLVLSMCGYNTMCEVMAFARRSVVIPRVYPRIEQKIRAHALEATGLLKVIEPDELNPETLIQALRGSLESDSFLPFSHRPSLDGVSCFQQRILDLEGTPPVFSMRPEHVRHSREESPVSAGGPLWNGESGQVGYFAKMFPRISETFILNEVLSLRRLGVPVRIYSILPPTRDKKMHDEAKGLIDEVSILPEPSLSMFNEFMELLFDCFRARPLATSQEILRFLLRPGQQSFRRLFRAAALAVQMRRDRVAHLHAAWAHTPASVARIASRLTGIPWSMGTHAKDVHLSKPESLAKKLASARFTLACSRSNQDLLMNIGTPSKKDLHIPSVTLLHHGVDTEYFHPDGRHLNRNGSGPPLILSVGRLVFKKGFDVLLQAAALLKQKNIEFRLHIVGEGPLRAHLEQQIISLGIEDKVLLRGLMVREEVRDAYQQADCVTLAARITPEGDRDGIPNTLAEAMACGVPVVATRLEGISELVEHGISGLLVRPEDPPDLAEALTLLLQDKDLRRKMGQSARLRIIRYFDSRPLHIKAARRFLKSLGIRRLLYVTADRGVPVRGTKGASIHVRSLIRAFGNLGVESLIMTTRPGPADGLAIPEPVVEPDAGAYMKRIAGWWRRLPGAGPVGEKQVLRLLDNLPVYNTGIQQARAWHPDIIYERYSLLSFAGILLARRLCIPHILEVNAPLTDEEVRFRGLRHAGFTHMVERWILRHAGLVVVVSEALKEYALTLGVSPDRILVLPNGVDPRLFYPGRKGIEIRDRLGWKREDFIVGFSGTMKPWHGVDHLLRAMARIIPSVPGSRLLLVGDGPGRPELERLAEEKGLKERVHFTGAVNHDEVPDYLAACDVLAAPYRQNENFYFSPIKVAEYMALGKPVVVSAIGQLKGFIQDSGGVTGVTPGDEEELAHVLTELALNPAHRRRLEKLSAHRSPWTWEDVARKILSEGERVRRSIWGWER